MCHADIPAPSEPSPDLEHLDHFVELPTGEAIPVTEVRPLGGAGPAVVLGTDIFGRSPFHLAIADLLARAGFTALVPEVFFRDEPVFPLTSEAAYARLAALDEPRAIDDLGAVVDWARSRSSGAAPVGFLGFCLGGTFALATAARRVDIVTVCFYGFPGGHPPKTGGVNAPAPLSAAATMRGPILGFWGADDVRVGSANVAALDDALSAAGVAHDFTVVPGVDHGFMSALLEGDAPAHEIAERVWVRTLDFLRDHLAASSASVP